MNVNELSRALNGTIIAGVGGADREITGGYCCDFLSFVIGKAKENDAWITVIGNLNTIAVASLADVGCIILAENSPLDDDAKVKANDENIPVIRCENTAFYLCAKVAKLLGL